MIMFDIAEWIANLLVLGLATLVWLIAIFGFCMLTRMAKKTIDNFTEGREQ